MKKIIILCAIFVLLINLSSTNLFCQEKYPKKISKFAEAMGKQMTDCCSDAHKKTEVVIHNYSISDTLIVITMTASWYGLATGDFYYIKGKMSCNKDGCNVKWKKIKDKGVFRPGCLKDCPFRCLDD